LRFALAKRFLAVADSVSLCDRLSGADAVAAVPTGIGDEISKRPTGTQLQAFHRRHFQAFRHR